ncbi:Activator of basal transcription 1 [Massospora cicadina]|nr:Activator of basal transcription 1 [Massospora cicadina]
MGKKGKKKQHIDSETFEEQPVLIDKPASEKSELEYDSLKFDNIENVSENSDECELDDQDDEIGRELDREELASKKKTISAEELEKFKAKIEKTGVVYISRIPPRMAASKLRRLLSRFKVKIGRIYLSPEDPQLRKKRKISGGTRQKMYTEGWIEFMDKNKAKALVNMINNTNMDPKSILITTKISGISSISQSSNGAISLKE